MKLDNPCTFCGEPGIPGLIHGAGKCQYHWNVGQFGVEWANEVKRRDAMNTTPLYIFDLDGTLADLKHRRHFVELQDGSTVLVERDHRAIYRGKHDVVEDNVWVEFPETGIWAYHKSDVTFKPNWDAFHAACVDDKPIQPVIELLLSLELRAEVWIWSGRMSTVREQTILWLDQNVIANDCMDMDTILTMRPAGDYTPDDQLKESWLKAMSPEDRARLVMVFDDRQRVVDMWRRNSVTCAQVAPGDF